MTQVAFVVSVLLLREGESWVAQCLEHDIAAQGSTLADAKKNFERTFVGQIVVDIENKRVPLAGIKQAPAAYWQKFNAGERLTDRQPFMLPEGIPPAYMISATADDLRIHA